MGRFLAMQPRDIVFSLCQYGWDDVPTWGAAVDPGVVIDRIGLQKLF